MDIRTLPINVGKSRVAHDMTILVLGEQEGNIIMSFEPNQTFVGGSGRWFTDSSMDMEAFWRTKEIGVEE